MRVCTLDQNRFEPFELGAILYALVLFPEAKDEHRWRNTSAALAARYVADQHKHFPSDRTQALLRRPEYLARNNRGALDGLRGRSSKAMEVGAMTLAYLQEATTGVNPLQVGRSGKLSLRQLAGVVRPDHPRSSSPETVYQDVRKTWHRWQPVAHLAAAYRWQHDKTGAEHFHWDLDDVDFHRRTVAIANAFAIGLAQMPQVPWRDCDPVDLRWIDYISVQENASSP